MKLSNRTVLGRYRTVAPLGRGGMGVVELGRTEGGAGFARPVVIKRLHADTAEAEDARGMFVREARILAELRHPGVVRALDFGACGSDLVLVLEYVPGYDLGQWLRHRRAIGERLPAAVALHVVASVLETLAYVHEHRRDDGRRVSVLHRDVSPSNVLVDARGQVLLTDFGIAKAHGATVAFATQRRSLKGKVPYMAPELLAPTLAPASPETDTYAAAVMLHEILAGKNELHARSFVETVERQKNHVPTPVSALRDDCPDELDAVLARALAKDPAARGASAAELASMLRAMAPDGAEALAREIERDFTRIPATLGIPTLAAREEAWRTPGSVTLAPSPASHPTIHAEGETSAVTTVSDAPTFHSRPTEIRRARTDDTRPTKAPPRHARTTRPSRAVGQLRRALAALAAAVALATALPWVVLAESPHETTQAP